MTKHYMSLTLLFTIAWGKKAPVSDIDGDGVSTEQGDCDDNTCNLSSQTDIVGDGIDQNCDGLDGTDVDGDGFASVASGGDDCDDTNVDVNTSIEEIWYDGVDGNCDNLNDYDQDGDGYVSDEYTEASGLPGGDCDDLEATIYTGVEDTWYDGIDSNCDGINDYDQDGDGYVLDEYTEASGLPGGDCNDENNVIFGEAEDMVGDDIDQNCDDLDGTDADGDGFASVASGGDDCDDTNVDVNTSIEEIWYDGVDGNCDNLNDYDQDGDGYVSDEYTEASGLPGGDCDDLEMTTYTGAEDTWYDGADSNCDGINDYDQDGDGYVLDEYTEASGLPGGDCDDLEMTTYTELEDTWYDGVDSNCDNLNDYDQDGDGYVHWDYESESASPGGDCNDEDASIYAGATEIWYDGIDSDCQGDSDFDQDGDGTAFYQDCDDTDALAHESKHI